MSITQFFGQLLKGGKTTVTDVQVQKKLLFFTEGTKPSKEDRLAYCNPDDSNSPFHSFVGNRKAIKRLSRVAFVALGQPDHIANSQNFALIGPPSTGKTTLAKLFAKILQLPFVDLNPRIALTGYDIFNKISQVCASTVVGNTSLQLVDSGNKNYVLPPLVIFIDEVHNLKKNVEQLLLTACEKTDHRLMTENGHVIDTNNVCWIIATTDRGELFDAFDTRFTKIYLNPYTKKELAQIVQLSNKEWDMDVCDLVARYNSVPREALAFAKDMHLAKAVNETATWEEIANEVAADYEIDEYGMTRQRMKILIALEQQKAISVNNLATIAGCKVEELRKFVLPPLIAATEDGPSLIAVSSRGYILTDAGKNEIQKRLVGVNNE